MLFRPHLSGEGEIGNITYPKLVSPKINGVRGINQDGTLYARSLKQIPNKHTSTKFRGLDYDGFDGELYVGNISDKNVFTNTTSAVMSIAGEPDTFWGVFDAYHPTLPFYRRIEELAKRHDASMHSVLLLPHVQVNNDTELQGLAAICTAEGYEGLVLRDPEARYKQGRSSDAEGSFLRFVPWHSGEVEILEIAEGQRNNNESVENELGYLKKSSAKSNVVGSGQAGSFKVRDIQTDAIFSMSVPTFELQRHVWANPKLYIGKIAKYSYKDGVKGNIPRFPQYQGLRSPLDMS